MKAICVSAARTLEVRNIPEIERPAPGHVIVDMDSSAINHGDKVFLKRLDSNGRGIPGSRLDVWGASGAGRVIAVGEGVPVDLRGRAVAIYRSLVRSPDTLGLWSERAHVPHHSCLLLPDTVAPRDYCGSLVNVFTAYAYLQEIIAAGHKAVVVTAGNSATGRALAALAPRWGVAVIALVRSSAAQQSLEALGVKNTMSVADEGYAPVLSALAAELGATAVFDGAGGQLISRIAPVLPMDSTIYVYGLLSPEPISLPSAVFMGRNLVMKAFSNFQSVTAKEPARLRDALSELQGCIAEPVFRTRIGREFTFDQIDEAMAYEDRSGSKAVLIPR